MNGPLRSKQGCWTCRLRRKKCDEGRPHCSTCELLSITCYGYGPKPDWMNNGEEERAVTNSLKEIVKHTSRRKAATQLSQQRDPIIKIAPRPLIGFVENSLFGSGLSHQHTVAPLADPAASRDDEVDVLGDGSADSHLAENGNHLDTGSMLSMSADESVLLMHFLDTVFPLQYPMYKPEIQDGGRGWLLALLLRNKPLYHAALALSAYHRRTLILEKISHPRRVAALVQQEKHFEICIKSVNHFAQNSCPYKDPSILNTVVQLMFLELFTGHGNAWYTHLRAAMNMYQRGHKENFTPFGLAEKTKTILREDLCLSEYEPVATEEVTNFRFLSCTLIWLDIMSSITAGTAPHLLPFHLRVIASDSQTKLEDIMGCKNWVMIEIGRIAALHERKTQAWQQGRCDRIEFEQAASDISRAIQCGLAQGAFEGFNLSERDPATMLNTMSDPTALVTQIFAYMASLYLHLVTHGFQKLEVLEPTISGAMRMLQTRTPIHLLPALVSALYIIGTVAGQGDEQYFRNIFSSPPLLNPLFKHRGRILSILEEIWSRRQTTPGFAWKDSLELIHDILLL